MYPLMLGSLVESIILAVEATNATAQRVIRSLHMLNEMLPPEDRLPPFTLSGTSPSFGQKMRLMKQ